MVQDRDDDLVPGLPQRPERLGQDVDVHGGGGADHHLVRRRPDHLRHAGVAVGHAFGRQLGFWVGGQGLNLGGTHIGRHAVDHCIGHVGAAGVFKKRPAVVEAGVRELGAHERQIEECLRHERRINH